MKIVSDGQNRYPGVIFVSSSMYELYHSGAKWDDETYVEIWVKGLIQGWATKEEAFHLQNLKTIEEKAAYLDQINFFGMIPEDFEIWINSLHWIN